MVFTDELEEFKRYIKESGDCLIVADDQTKLLMKCDQALLELVIQKSHPNRKALILVTHNLYIYIWDKNHHVECIVSVIFSSLRDMPTILRLGYQLMLLRAKFTLQAFEHAVASHPFG